MSEAESGHLVSDVSIDSHDVELSESEAEMALKNLIIQRAPSSEQLTFSLKMFFEGPLNLDLMLLGLVKNRNMHKGHQPTSAELVSAIQNFSTTIVYSQQAT